MGKPQNYSKILEKNILKKKQLNMLSNIELFNSAVKSYFADLIDYVIDLSANYDLTSDRICIKYREPIQPITSWKVQ